MALGGLPEPIFDRLRHAFGSGACGGMFGQYWRSHAESCVDYRFDGGSAIQQGKKLSARPFSDHHERRPSGGVGVTATRSNQR